MEQARWLAENGYYVYPVDVQLDDRGKKRPRFPGSWANSTREPGFEFDLGQPGLVIDCEKSGIVVIDIDAHGEVDGRAALEAAGIPLPATPMTVKSWSGGEHRFFRSPGGTPSSQGVPVAGVDIRAGGGIIFGPGTVVFDARGERAGEYAVTGRATPVAGLPVLPPEFAAELLNARPAAPGAALQPFTGALSPVQRATLERWLEDDQASLRAAGDGQRHRALLAYAAKILGRAVQLGYPKDAAVRLVRLAYEASGGTEWPEKRAVVEWAARRLEAEPLGVPADWASASEADFEDAVRAAVTKIRVREEAQRRAQRDDSGADLGRELDFNEPPNGLHGRSWCAGLLNAGETTLLFGERNVGKSFVAMDVGLSIATGRPYHGHPVTQGRVLYLAGEGAIGLPARRRAWAHYHRVSDVAGLYLRDRIVRLRNPESVEAWQKQIVDQEIDVVVLDTLRRAARGAEMESPGDAQELIELMDDLRSVRHGTSVLALGHPTKSQPDQPAGAGTVQDSLPMIHRLTKDDGEGLTAIIDLVTTKSKDGPTGRYASFSMHPVSDSLVFKEYRG